MRVRLASPSRIGASPTPPTPPRNFGRRHSKTRRSEWKVAKCAMTPRYGINPHDAFFSLQCILCTGIEIIGQGALVYCLSPPAGSVEIGGQTIPDTPLYFHFHFHCLHGSPSSNNQGEREKAQRVRLETPPTDQNLPHQANKERLESSSHAV
jgi:hypothetical protein